MKLQGNPGRGLWMLKPSYITLHNRGHDLHSLRPRWGPIALRQPGRRRLKRGGAWILGVVSSNEVDNRGRRL